MVDLITDRLETVGKQLLGTERKLILYGKNLLNSVSNPDEPQYMKQRYLRKEVSLIQNSKFLRSKEAKHTADYKNNASADKPYYITFSGF